MAARPARGATRERTSSPRKVTARVAMASGERRGRAFVQSPGRAFKLSEAQRRCTQAMRLHTLFPILGSVALLAPATAGAHADQGDDDNVHSGPADGQGGGLAT